MPAKSRAQQRLMAAAEHGATFPMAKALRQSMNMKQLHDFASGPMKGKPEHVKAAPKAQFRSEYKPKNLSAHPGSNLGKFLHPKKGAK